MLDFSYSEAQISLRQSIIDCCAEVVQEVSPLSSEEQFRQRWAAFGRYGLPGLTVPKSYGGRGLNALDTAIALEALGYAHDDAGFNFALAAHVLACVTPIWTYGSAEQQKRWLPQLSDGRSIATNAMTEESAGSDVYQMKSRATLQEDGRYLINGHKTYASNGPLADIVVTYVLTNEAKGFFGGISAFVLEGDSFYAGPKIEKVGLESCQLSEIFFDESTVSDQHILGEAGGGGPIFQASMEWERICLGALHLGEMERLLEQAVRFAKKRKSGGQSISKYQAVSHPLAELKTRITAGRQLLHLAAWQLDQGDKVQQISAMAKLMVSETYRDFALQLQQLYAGAAFKAGNPIERCLRDAMAATVYSGTSEIQKNIIARYLGLR